MNKKKLLIVAHHLTIGGVQKSLITALKVIDYDKFDVTLYLRKNRTDLLPFVDSRVNVIINDDKTRYYRKPYAILMQLLTACFRFAGKKNKAEAYNKKLSDFIVKKRMEYEKNHFFSSDKYDIAIAYVQGYAALFVAECINAEKKFLFYHTSVDELHHIHNKVIHKFNKVVAIHDQQAEMMKQWYPQIKDKVSIVENFCDKTLLQKQSEEFEINRPEDKFILCSCGRFSPVKGFDLAVEAAKKLKEKNIPFLWYFVGDGPERANIEKLITKYNLQEDIIITGMQNNPYPYVKACDVYAQPSYEESFGLTIVEAQRLNKMVVSTKTMGGIKLINDGSNGRLCDISAESLAESIYGVLTDKDISESILNKLDGIDYSGEKSLYQTQWKNLLEG